jgi:VNT family MFS transporter (synaptic vesicle glycoprotein 2)
MFLGMLVGGYVWGSLGDIYGRRRSLIAAMFFNATFGFGSSFSQVKTTFIAMRFLSGLGVGGSIPLVWTYFAEFQPKAMRGAMISALATFWMIGNVSVAGKELVYSNFNLTFCNL